MTNQGISIDKEALSILEIPEKARKILVNYTDDGAKLDLEDINAVVAQIKRFLDETGRTDWTKDDVKKILDRLEVRRNPRAYETSVRWNAFRHAAEKLTSRHHINCPKVKIPKRSRRYLIYESDDHILKNVALIQALHDDLLKLRPFKAEQGEGKRPSEAEKDKSSLLKELEIEYLCSFVASAAIFGKVLFDDFHLSLLKLRCKDIFLNTCYINVSYSDTNALRRFFLPYPASVYLMRCIMFYRDNAVQLGMKPLDHPENNVFNEDGLIKNFATNFREWIAKRLRKLGYECGDGLTTYEFRAAVKRASYGELANAVEYPPFILAIQSNAEAMVSHSYGNCHFPYFANIKAERYDYEEKRQNSFIKRDRSSRKKQRETAGTLPEVIDDIALIRRKLDDNNKVMQTKAKREEVIDEAFKQLAKSTLDPWSDDYHNVYLYLLWFEDMVMASGNKFGSMNTYASQVPRLLYQISGTGAIDSLPLGDLVENISQTMYLYNSKGIKRAIKHFCDFLLSVGLKHFGEIKWRSKTLMKKNRPSMKAFIPFEDFEAALNKATTFFPRYAYSLKNSKKKGEKIAAAKHKAKIYRMLMALGYFAGMRVSEIIRLKIGDIKGNQYLIIKKSKTKSGKRNLYLESLLPEGIYKELLTYINERKHEAKNENAFLFTQRNGKAWLYNQVSEDVARLFYSLGYRNFRFHHLRHAFANVFVLRWVHAFHSAKVPSDAKIFEHETFKDKKEVQFKRLLFGIAAGAETCKDEMNFVIFALSKLIGHSSPKVTLTEYFHCGDIIFYLWSRDHDDIKIKFDNDKVRDFLRQKPNDLPDYVKFSLLNDFIHGRQFYEIQKSVFKSLPWTSSKNKVDLAFHPY